MIENAPVPPKNAWRILFCLMFPAALMPLMTSMESVALPVIRDAFGLQADDTAWVATAFTLPFMLLMPVYGRLGDAVGQRRLLLIGVVVCSVGTILVFTVVDLTWLMIGRVIQGIGLAGTFPLGLAMISAIFAPKERGNALGIWSTIGPLVGFVAPFAAGILVGTWGWRVAFLPTLLLCIVTYVVIANQIPANFDSFRPRFLQTFDWGGVLLLSGSLIVLLFYLSSGPITGVPPLQDWRLLMAAVLLSMTFLWWEQRHKNPFLPLSMYRDSSFTQGSLGAFVRMLAMMAAFFLLPLYLVGVRNMSPYGVGVMGMIMPGAMALTVWFVRRHSIVARPIDVWPTISAVSKLIWKCSDQSSIRGLNRRTSS
ncbi:MAG: MFS transporter [Chloroflexota bacterium]